jgi:hypothetical protein
MAAVQSAELETFDIDLRNPNLAAFLAWLCPGAGHFYQRRYAKGTLFLVCILGIYLFGLIMGGGHVVYTSWNENDKRWQYFCQLGVGAAALPALIQNRLVKEGKPPLLGGWMAPPKYVAGTDDHLDLKRDELATWNLQYHTYFDLGTLFTMIAGLLNVLAIYDAYAGPMVISHQDNTDKPPPDAESGKGGK